jgi:hypothetical protein
MKILLTLLLGGAFCAALSAARVRKTDRKQKKSKP